MSSLNGRTIDGKYVIQHCLGEGGMGAVFLAQHVGIGRDVALKVVQPELLTNPAAIERFKREARAAGGLRHPNVVNVTDFGVADVDGEPLAYLVMEHLTGQTLAAVLEERRTLRLRVVVDIVSQIADALDAAHASGIVHRDLKPANIWLTPDPRGSFRVTLLDFGIAKLRDETAFAIEPPPAAARVPEMDTDATEEATLARGGEDHTLVKPSGSGGSTEPFTRIGEIVGTPAYMSPEQCSGGTVDHRSDIYSLGIVVFRMLAGALPFTGSAFELIQKHRSEAPPDLRGAGVTPAIAEVVAHALAKKPEERFHSARGFARALEAQSLGATESLRRATALFSERGPELLPIGAWLMIPPLIALGLAVLFRIDNPVLMVVAIQLVFFVALTFGSTVAMASMATVFEELQSRPFSVVTWQRVAQVIGGEGSTWLRTIARWFWRPVVRYVKAMQFSRGEPLPNMLFFIGQYRGLPVDDDRIRRMARTVPRRTFASMMFLQLSCIFALPLVAGLAAFGLLEILRVDDAWYFALIAGGFGFALLQPLQILVGLVDVMLFDAAYAASED